MRAAWRVAQKIHIQKQTSGNADADMGCRVNETGKKKKNLAHALGRLVARDKKEAASTLSLHSSPPERQPHAQP